MIQWKSNQYYGSQQLFSDQTAVRILEELASTNNEDCCGMFNVLFVGERPIAIHLGMMGPRDYWAWFPAYDPELARFSPGTMMWFALAEEAARRDITRIDLGYGQDSYKFHLTTESHSVAGGAVWASRTEQVGRKIYRRLVQRV
jgi:CelD/BcsL family acetyltransferase involved in cellulose biosynthesis